MGFNEPAPRLVNFSLQNELCSWFYLSAEQTTNTMKYNFKLLEFPNTTFEIESSIWTGKSTLMKDGIIVAQSSEKGNPFLIPNGKDTFLKAFPKSSFPDSVPVLEINGKKHHILEKLKWWQYLIAGLPILLLFMGGAIGGALGGVTTVINLSIMRQSGSEVLKYLKVIGIVLAAYLGYALIASYFFDGTI